MPLILYWADSGISPWWQAVASLLPGSCQVHPVRGSLGGIL
ncbi:hypothetical protein SynA1840_00870 [Synechococcus sp. A18-40]|nr:hypothetical protein SynA1840_00870 [Synechococcus sp. A18-40]